MRAVRFTLAEVALLRKLLGPVGEWTKPEQRAHDAITAKLNDAEEEKPKGISGQAIEQALVRSARGKVVALVGGGAGYARASKQAAQAGATVEDAEVLGAWLARQGWMRDPTTVLGVLNKWAEWLPRARATAAPVAAREGFNEPRSGATGPGADRPGGGGGGWAGPPGFR